MTWIGTSEDTVIQCMSTRVAKIESYGFLQQFPLVLHIGPDTIWREQFNGSNWKHASSSCEELLKHLWRTFHVVAKMNFTSSHQASVHTSAALYLNMKQLPHLFKSTSSVNNSWVPYCCCYSNTQPGGSFTKGTSSTNPHGNPGFSWTDSFDKIP